MVEEEKITAPEKSQKVKDPKRVEAGKKLGLISKEAKERKARERFAVEPKTSDTQTQSPSLYIAVASVVVVGGLWYVYKKVSTKASPTEEPQQQQQQQQPQSQTPKLDTL